MASARSGHHLWRRPDFVVGKLEGESRLVAEECLRGVPTWEKNRKVVFSKKHMFLK
jgi:hypothetical protein